MPQHGSKALGLISLFGLWLGFAVPAQSHPHEWIDIKVRLLFDDQKHLVAMEQTWLFDPYFTSYVLPEFEQARPNRKTLRAQAEELGPTMITNLHEHGYLNTWTFDEAPVEELTGVFDSTRVLRDRMELNFTLKLREPLDLAAGRFVYGVFDPTYYIEILHAERHQPALKGAARGCKADIQTPEPDEGFVLAAQSTDLDQTSDDGLGIHFAEFVSVSCPK